MTAPPPVYVSRATLAYVLGVTPSAVDDLVDLGALPRTIRIPPGCDLWRWKDVEPHARLHGGSLGVSARGLYGATQDAKD